MFDENNEFLMLYQNDENWLEYKEMKNKVLSLFVSLIGEKLLDVISLVDEENNLESGFYCIVCFETKKIFLDTKSCYVWIIEQIDNNLSDYDFLGYEDENRKFDSLIVPLNLNIILNQSLKDVLVHNKFEYPQDDFFYYSGIILVFDKAALHIFDNGDELGIRLLFEDPNELKKYISDDN